jgi:hypothetical protein
LEVAGVLSGAVDDATGAGAGAAAGAGAGEDDDDDSGDELSLETIGLLQPAAIRAAATIVAEKIPFIEVWWPRTQRGRGDAAGYNPESSNLQAAL